MLTVSDLEAYGDAWNRHDIDAIMRYMTDDCVFILISGDNAEGTRFEGASSVRERFIDVWTSVPDVRFENVQHFVSGDRGVSQWTFVGTRTDGTPIRVNGLDLFTFRGDKIWIKDSYFKHRK